jgi:hypothetical protein
VYFRARGAQDSEAAAARQPCAARSRESGDWRRRTPNYFFFEVDLRDLVEEEDFFEELLRFFDEDLVDFFELDFFEEDLLDFFDDDFFEPPDFFADFDPFGGGGTFPPASRASDKPMAMACLRLFTFLPDPPLRSFPSLNSCITFSTLSCDFFP